MTLFLDSADLDDIKSVVALGLAKGITMNPALLRSQTDNPLKHLHAVLDTFPGLVMYQPTKVDGDALGEALRAHEFAPKRVIVKIQIVAADLPVATELVRRGVPVALTAAAAAGHMLVCEALGARYLIPYVDRAARDRRCDAHLVRALASVRHGDVCIVAASVKSTEQAVNARHQGADIVSAPAAVLRGLIEHPMSQEAADDFDRKYAQGGTP